MCVSFLFRLPYEYSSFFFAAKKTFKSRKWHVAGYTSFNTHKSQANTICRQSAMIHIQSPVYIINDFGVKLQVYRRLDFG